MSGVYCKRPQSWSHSIHSVEGKAVVISGGTSGIGRATARLLASQGAHVLVFGRHEPELRETLEELRTFGDGIGLTADQTCTGDVQRVFELADSRLHGVDIMINNAAVPNRNTTKGSYEDWEETVRTNVLGYMLCARCSIERMHRDGGGQIINVGSLAARGDGYTDDVYIATKGAIKAWSDSLRKEVASNGIRVALIEPASVDTPLQEDRPSAPRLSPEDVAEAIHFCLIQPPSCAISTVQLEPGHVNGSASGLFE